MSLKLTFRKARSSKDKTKRGTYYIEGTDHRGRRVHKSAAGKAPDSTLIFECETRWGIPQLFKRAQKRAGLDRRRPHEIGRHAFAKRILEAGESTLTVKDAGGWKTLRMVDEYYGHLARERTDQVVAGIDTRALQQSTPKSHPDQNASPAITDKQRKNVA
jgi:integrase